MANFEFSEHLDESPAEVFDFMTNIDHASAIRPAIRAARLLESGPQGRVKRFEVKRQQGGHEVASEVSVLHGERPFRYTLATEREGLKLVYDYHLEPDNGGTKITLKGEVQGEKTRQALAWLVARTLESQDADLLRALKLAMARENEPGA